MAGSYNKVILMGNLTRDVELRQIPSSNTAIAKLGLAVNRKWRSNEGEMKEEVTFVDCDAFGRTAENLARFFRKGRPIFIEGHLRLDQWEKEGQKFSKLKVVVDNFQFVDSREGGGPGGGGGGGGGNYSDSPAPARSAPSKGGNSGGGANYEPMGEEDIPF